MLNRSECYVSFSNLYTKYVIYLSVSRLKSTVTNGVIARYHKMISKGGNEIRQHTVVTWKFEA